MNTLSALGVLVGGFLVSPPPKAVVTTLLWGVSRSHLIVGIQIWLNVSIYRPKQIWAPFLPNLRYSGASFASAVESRHIYGNMER